jgi:hypothetical protein
MGFRSVRKSYRYRNRYGRPWGQIAISACLLLAPPIAIGAIAYSMLPPRPDRSAIVISVPNRMIPSIQAHAAAGPVIALPEVAPPVSTTTARAMPQAAEQPATALYETDLLASVEQKMPEPIRSRSVIRSGNSAAPSASAIQDEETATTAAVGAPANGTGGYAFADAGHELTQKDLARVPVGPVPVHVTVVTAPNAARADVGETSNTSARSAATSSAPLTDVPQERSGLVAGLAAEARGLRSARSHFRSYIRHLAHRGAVRTETRQERAARWQSKSQHELSLGGFLQQLGTTSQRDAQRADASGGHNVPR